MRGTGLKQPKEGGQARPFLHAGARLDVIGMEAGKKQNQGPKQHPSEPHWAWGAPLPCHAHSPILLWCPDLTQPGSFSLLASLLMGYPHLI